MLMILDIHIHWIVMFENIDESVPWIVHCCVVGGCCELSA